MSFTPNIGLRLALAGLVFLIGLQFAIALSAARDWTRSFDSRHNPTIAGQLESAANLLDRLSVSERRDAVAALSSPYLRFTLIADFPDQEPESPILPTFKSIVESYAEVFGTKRPFRIYRRNHDGILTGLLFGSGAHSGRVADDFIILVRLTDGAGLAVEASPEYKRGVVLNILSVTTAVTGLICLGLLIWAAFATTRPMSRIGIAAERLAGNLNALPLEERGPTAVRNLARSFNSMQRQIKQLVAERTMTLAAIAHDYRTYLTRLRLRAEYIEDETQREKAVHDLDEMSSLIDETLYWAQEADKAPSPTRETIAHVVDNVVAARHEAASPVTVSISSEARDAQAHVSSTGLRRALDNLIDNAVRYGHEARVDVFLQSDDIVIRVTDDGEGVPEEDLARLTDPFYRVEDSRSRHTGGTGLGLAISQSLIEAAGGSLSLRNGGHGGLEASIRFPRATGATGTDK